MNNYGDKLKALGLTELQVVTILSGWSYDSIESLRGEISPPSHEGIVQAIVA